jgi:ABC-type branched-subunit amino acid transport system substrate-binding protein
MEIFCTRPRKLNEDPHWNSISDDRIYAAYDDDVVKQQLKDWCCETCGMPLILDNARYAPIREIGQGGFGRTFEAFDRRLVHQQVLKQLRSDVFCLFESHLLKAKELFQRETNVLVKLRHDQIPRIDAPLTVKAQPDIRFQAQTSEPSPFLYLSQGYIDGVDLQQALRPEVPRWQEREVRHFLTKLLKVLQYVHEKGIIHRDVKPSNIIQSTDGVYHLVDFGAAKVLQAVKNEMNPASQIKTYIADLQKFVAPELSQEGEAYAESDLYSLAATCVALLTGKTPKDLGIPGDLNWHRTTSVTPRLAAVLNKMLQPDYRKRYHSAAEVLRVLNPPRFPLWQQLLLGLVGVGLVGLLLWRVIHPPQVAPIASIASIDNPSDFSRGEEVLVNSGKQISGNQACTNAFDEKQKGTNFFAKGEYQRAIDSFERALLQFEQTRRGNFLSPIDQGSKKLGNDCFYDPESLIFLNNARAALHGNPLTIVVSLPLGGADDATLQGSAIETLTGVALVQQSFNENAKLADPMLQIILTKDYLNSENTKQVAQQLLVNKIPGESQPIVVLGVIGHLTSTQTLAASAVYQGSKLVLISPSSTAVRSSDYVLADEVFRTATTDTISGQDLAAYAKSNDRREKPRVLIIYDPANAYSQSLAKVLADATGQKDLSNACIIGKYKTAEQCMKDADAQGAKILILTVGTNYADKAKEILRQNQERSTHLTILAGDAQYSSDLLTSVGTAADDMVVAVPWYRELANRELASGSFTEELKKSFGTGSVSWRVATAYDAASALVRAIDQAGAAPTRTTVYEALKQLKPIQGATGTVEFCSSGDRKVFTGLGVLVQVETVKGQQTFKLLKTPKRSNDGCSLGVTP